MLGIGALGELALAEGHRFNNFNQNVSVVATGTVTQGAMTVGKLASIVCTGAVTQGTRQITKGVAITCTPVIAVTKAVVTTLATVVCTPVVATIKAVAKNTIPQIVVTNEVSRVFLNVGKQVNVVCSPIVEALTAVLRVISTEVLQKPINCVVEWMIPLKGVDTDYEIPPAQRTETTKVRKGPVRRYGAASTFKVTTNKRGYD
jgi:hypothetical protein